MEHPSAPVRRHSWHRVTLAQMQRVKNWHAAQGVACPVEKGVWEIVLAAWLMGWIGWLPAFAFEAYWTCPFCLMGMFAPGIYVAWRARSDERHLLRCDWLESLNRPRTK